VLETSTSYGPTTAATRAPMCTANPATASPMTHPVLHAEVPNGGNNGECASDRASGRTEDGKDPVTGRTDFTTAEPLQGRSDRPAPCMMAAP